jgi:hypothetical protein
MWSTQPTPMCGSVRLEHESNENSALDHFGTSCQNHSLYKIVNYFCSIFTLDADLALETAKTTVERITNVTHTHQCSRALKRLKAAKTTLITLLLKQPQSRAARIFDPLRDSILCVGLTRTGFEIVTPDTTRKHMRMSRPLVGEVNSSSHEECGVLKCNV